MRPTYGLVSRNGAMALSWTLDKIGPICRSAEDCGLVLERIAGGDDDDPSSAHKSFYYTPQFANDFKDIRVGFAPVDFNEGVDPAARPDYAKALETIRSLGVQVTEAKMPVFPYGAMISTIISAEGSAVFEPLIKSGQVDQLADQHQIAGLKAGLQIPANEYLKAMRIRALMQEAFRDLLSTIDVLIAPTRFDPAPKITQPLDRPVSDRPTPAAPGLTALIPAGNLAGLPALTVPCGFADGMPMGLQLLGSRFSENTLLAIGKAFQDRTDWHKRRPPVAESSVPRSVYTAARRKTVCACRDWSRDGWAFQAARRGVRLHTGAASGWLLSALSASETGGSAGRCRLGGWVGRRWLGELLRLLHLNTTSPQFSTRRGRIPQADASIYVARYWSCRETTTAEVHVCYRQSNRT